jgi:hypothetical protein
MAEALQNDDSQSPRSSSAIAAAELVPAFRAGLLHASRDVAAEFRANFNDAI